MALVITSAPAVEPVTVSEAKAHLRVDGTAEDTLIGSLILTSRLHIEAALGLALMTQSWRLTLDAWPNGRELELPLRPLRSLTSVKIVAADGTAETIPSSSYVVDIDGTPPRLVRNGGSWPQPEKAANGIEIEFTAGFGDEAADVPAPIRQALLMLIAHWYEHRDPIEVGSRETLIPAAVSDLLAPYRTVRL